MVSVGKIVLFLAHILLITYDLLLIIMMCLLPIIIRDLNGIETALAGDVVVGLIT